MSSLLGLDATSAAAVGTIALAVTGAIGVGFNIAAVKAANKQARASSQTVGEMRLSRQLEWRPHLTFGPFPSEVVVTNIGRGIALYACLARGATHTIGNKSTSEVRRSALFLLATNESTTLAMSGELTPAPDGGGDYAIVQRLTSDLVVTPGVPQTIDICVCEDEFGNKFRFRDGGQRFDRWYKAGQGKPPPWTQWHEPDPAAVS